MYPNPIKSILLCSLLLVLILPYSTVYSQTVKASSFGYNSSDATNAFQTALRSNNDTIIIDKRTSDWNVRPSKLFDINNKVIIFENGVKLKAIPGEFDRTNAQMLFLVRPKNLKILGYGAEIIMNKSELSSLQHSEGRHAININSGDNVTIEGLTIRDATGDGIYIVGSGKDDSSSYSKNITLRNVEVYNSFRQGISIISVEDFLAVNCRFSDTKGTLPEAGLDIEPNSSFERVVNVRFENCRFTDNNHSGILLALLNLDSTSEDVSISFTDCYLTNNHVESNIYSPSEIVLGASKNFNSPVKGDVSFERVFVENSQWRAIYSRKTSNSYNVNIKDCVFKNVSQHPTYEFNSPIFFEVSSYDETSPNLGGYNFDNVIIDYETDHKFFTVFGHTTLSGVSNLTGNVTVIHPDPDNTIEYRRVPEFDNITINHKTIPNYPKADVTIKSVNKNAIESNGTEADFEVKRTGGDINLPLAVNYTFTGRALAGLDVQRITPFLIVPSGSSSFSKSLVPRKDKIKENIEFFKITTQSSSYYDRDTNERSTTVYVLDDPDTDPIAIDDFDTYSLQGDTKKTFILENDNTGDFIDPTSLRLIDPNDSTNLLSSYFSENIGTWTIQDDNSIEFSPCITGNSNCTETFAGDNASIQYSITDLAGIESTSATLTLTRDGDVIPDPLPIAIDDDATYTAGELTEVDVLSNDDTGDRVNPTTLRIIDESQSPPTYVTALVIPNIGTWEVNTENNTIDFNAEDTLTDEFAIIKYIVKDFQDNSTSATISLKKKEAPIDILPIATDDFGTFTIGEPTIVDVSSNDTSGDTIIPSSVKIIDENANNSVDRYVTTLQVENQGLWEVNSTNGTITFTPEENIAENEVSIRYSIEDPQENKAFASIFLTKNGVDPDPDPDPEDLQAVANDDNFEYVLGDITVIPILQNDINTEVLDFSTLRILDAQNNELTILANDKNAVWKVNTDDNTISFDSCILKENNVCTEVFNEETTSARYSIKDSSGNVLSANINLKRKDLTSIMSLYPNPNNGSFSVISDKEITNGWYSINDILGNTLLERSDITGGFSFDVNVDFYRKGIYLIRINEKGINTHTIKFVVN
ncbi:T9SS type A sorting domain-containing protein [Aquimarina sp. RZ0]|uniref:right-handed parallel beta-helix repeat-containing protein n=1 Tax=Aquimarina sp. RZ0 TaxID=2607730 RepID=UPI0011F09C50|nr:T9SS type A sorting domain-containing protein [Aquimarina sp. RZ0]KAA1246940.1 T9SS type A sorting domain-containing protein [Aquimarina sp. RZ0]